MTCTAVKVLPEPLRRRGAQRIGPGREVDSSAMVESARRIPSFAELYAEVEALPETLTGEIFPAGVLRTMSRPGRPHRYVHRRLQRDLEGIDRNVGGAGWWIEFDAEIRLGDELFVPDLAGWRVERVPEFPDDNPILLTPDWCCELLSPSTARADRTEKLPLYARRGVAWVWLVDPALRCVEVYACEGGRPTLVQTAVDNATIALPPFEIDLALGNWWLPAQP